MMTNVGSLSRTSAGPRVQHIDVLSDFLKETCAETKAAHTIATWKQSVEDQQVPDNKASEIAKTDAAVVGTALPGEEVHLAEAG